MNQEIRKIESITDSERVSGKIDKLDLQSRQIEKERERKKKEKNRKMKSNTVLNSIL